jgi:hypothetical protein
LLENKITLLEKHITLLEKKITKPNKKSPFSGGGEALARPLSKECATQPSFDNACV